MKSMNKKKIIVVAAIIEKDKRILIGKRKKEKHFGGKWEFPGGKKEDEETPRACLEREFQEEFNVVIRAKEFFEESVYEHEDMIIQLVGYKADYISGVFMLKDHSEIRWVAADDLNRYEFCPADIPLVEKIIKEA